MIKYIPFKEILHSDEFGNYISFGIKVINNCENELLSVSDVTPDEQLAVSLCNECTQGQLDPIHLYDVIDDIL